MLKAIFGGLAFEAALPEENPIGNGDYIPANSTSSCCRETPTM